MPGALALLPLLGGALVALSLHPFLTYPLSLLAIRAWRGERAPAAALGGQRPPSVALIVCAYNEEACLPGKLADLAALLDRHPGLDVRIYSDASTDRTVEVLQAADPRLTVVVGQRRLGKGAGINRLMEGATADLVVFSDANVLLDPDVVERLCRHFRDPEVGLVCGTVRRLVDDDAASPAVTAAYYRFEHRLKSLESAVDTTIMTDGSLYAIRRALFRPIRQDLMDDASTSTSILCNGHRMLQVDDVRGRERDDTGFVRELQRKRRIACQAFRCHLEMRAQLRRLPALRSYMYHSHKALRWFSGILLAAGAGLLLAWAAITRPAMTGFALVALAALAVVATLLARHAALRAVAVAAALTYASLGALDALRGRTHIPWTPVRTPR